MGYPDVLLGELELLEVPQSFAKHLQSVVRVLVRGVASQQLEALLEVGSDCVVVYFPPGHLDEELDAQHTDDLHVPGLDRELAKSLHKRAADCQHGRALILRQTVVETAEHDAPLQLLFSHGKLQKLTAGLTIFLEDGCETVKEGAISQDAPLHTL